MIPDSKKKKSPMIAFHLDMKTAQYRPDYLRELFKRLASAKYTHVFFEMEDKVRLESIRGAEWCEAFSKEEFSGLLKDARSAGLSPIPLIQTLGHLEFLLSHGRYHAWREKANSAYMICPSNPDAVKHLLRYIDEVGELFDTPSFFHLGADETYHLGACPECARRVKSTSKSAVFMSHLNTLATHVLKRGTRPVAWADHALKHPEDIDGVDRNLVWMDWDYWTPERNPEFLISWRNGKRLKPDELPEVFLANEGKFALDNQGHIRPWFYTDYLSDKGFDVMIAPAMRSGGDHVFAPRISHLSNVAGACMRMERDPKPLGLMVTSWALRLNSLETQWPGIVMPGLFGDRKAEIWRDLSGSMTQAVFGRPAPEFFVAWEKIEPPLPLAESHLSIENNTYFYGQTDTVPYLLNRWREEGRLDEIASDVKARHPKYQEGRQILDQLSKKFPVENLSLRFWRFAARAMEHKSAEMELSIKSFKGQTEPAEAARLLLEAEILRDDYRELLSETYLPASVERELSMIFNSSLRHLLRLANA